MVAKKYPTKFVPITIARSDGVTVPEKDNEVRAPPDQQAEMDLKWRMAIGDFLKDQFAAKGDGEFLGSFSSSALGPTLAGR